MFAQTYNALVVREISEGQFVRRIESCELADLPPGDVLVKVRYSALNYKDALSATGNRGVTRHFPHTPGIDAAGQVAKSSQADFAPGDEVIVTSYDLGMNTAGGFGGYIRVPSAWVVKKPAGLSLKESMILGTAGFTAGLSVMKLVQGGVAPKGGEVLVTGATGGVGSLAVAILAKAGYSVVGASGKADDHAFLIDLGAKQVIDRDQARDESGRPLLKARWAGVVDTLGGDYLATAIKSAAPWSIVTCCGNVASPKLDTTVFPFILRGVTLCGIDSQNCLMPLRQTVWDKLASAWKPEDLEGLCSTVALEDLDPKIDAILKGQLKGRTVVAHD